MSDNLLAAAIAFAGNSLPVFPCEPRGKAPMVEGGFKAATVNTEQIRKWWSAWPLANIGIPTGAVSGFAALDIDPGGDDSLAELTRQYGALPETRGVKTGRGRQLWFRHPGVPVRCSAGVLGRGLDFRGDGGYVIAPPSIHPNGQRYAFLNNCEPVEMADWLIRLTAQRKAEGSPNHDADSKIPEGSRNVKLASIAGSLRRQGLSELVLCEVLLGINSCQCDPPLPEAEVASIAASVARYAPDRVQNAAGTCLRAIKVGEFLRMDIKPREMLLNPLLPVQGLAMIHAKRGVGKTHIALGIAVAVASGKAFLRWNAPKPRKVLFVDGELPSGVLQQWVAEAVAAIGANEVGDNLTIITPDLQEFSIPDLATLGGQAALSEHVEAADLVILDNLSALVRAGNENDAESWLPIQGWALDLRRRGKSVLFIHHSGRSGNARGTSKREDLLDTIITLRHSPSYRADEGLRAELHFEKTRHFHGKGAEPFEVELRAGTDSVCQWVTRNLEASGYEKAAALFVEGCDALAVMEELGISRAQAYRYQKQYRESQSHGLPPRA